MNGAGNLARNPASFVSVALDAPPRDDRHIAWHIKNYTVSFICAVRQSGDRARKE